MLIPSGTGPAAPNCAYPVGRITGRPLVAQAGYAECGGGIQARVERVCIESIRTAPARNSLSSVGLTANVYETMPPHAV